MILVRKLTCFGYSSLWYPATMRDIVVNGKIAYFISIYFFSGNIAVFFEFAFLGMQKVLDTLDVL
jgi:hypothetical protein